ncbi:fuconate dehydratase [Microbacteriaceae bacterium VKM Ac-2854]|nr:fuconate dehydratase [Microbacteriaceae bacterium VKM Ac-2854]
MPNAITRIRCDDIRFPTSRGRDGSDAMNPDPDYSAAYLVIETASGAEGHAFVFTIGRGNDVQVAAIRALEGHILGSDADALIADMGETSRRFVYDSQLRWLGPEKGVMQMAIGAVVNALWDLRARSAGLPLWLLLGTLAPAELVDLVDFRYLSDALTPRGALDILERAESGRAERIAALVRDGYPAYTTTPGWLGYSDERLDRLSRQAVRDGFEQIKLKVGGDLEEDRRRMRIARAAVGPDIRIAVDANQRWDVDVAIRWMAALAEFQPAWIEEPTSPDDILGHATIRRAISTPVATGEQVHSRVMFKQLLQAGAIDVLQLDAVRVAGVNENVAILLLAAAFDTPVCPHAGGVGLCEVVQHLSMFDFVAVSGRQNERMIEYVDHLHEHFVDPVRLRHGRYLAPSVPGSSAEMLAGSRLDYAYPSGSIWAAEVAR